jgi:hypothetical protein
MGLTVDLRFENGKVIERWGPGPLEPDLTMPGLDDLTYPYLRLVDPYSNTYFSTYQMRAVVPELERLAAEKPLAAVTKVLAMARACQAGIGLHLVFIGD